MGRAGIRRRADPNTSSAHLSPSTVRCTYTYTYTEGTYGAAGPNGHLRNSLREVPQAESMRRQPPL
jgi:hypothetical protein